MMSLSQIRYESARAARKAARTKKQPYLFEEEDRATMMEKSNAIPNLGNYVPKGWELVETYFVDSSGFGNDSEPAMTIERFIAAMKPGYGYAVIEAGEFQVVIGEFFRVS
jgi:hypothetical protein